MLSNNIFFFSLHIFSGWGWARSGKGKWSQLELSGDFEDFHLSEFGLSCEVTTVYNFCARNNGKFRLSQQRAHTVHIISLT